MILLNSLPDEEYETFVLTIINNKQILNYSDVSASLVNYEVRRKDKQSSSKSTTVEAMTGRGMCQIIGRARESLKSLKSVIVKI